MFIQTRLTGDALCVVKVYKPRSPQQEMSKMQPKDRSGAENTFYMPTVYNNDGGGGGDFVPVID